MNFKDIFNEEGLYRADSFAKGVAFEVKKCKSTGAMELYTITYSSPNDISSNSFPTLVYGGLFDMEYAKVYTRQSLFN